MNDKQKSKEIFWPQPFFTRFLHILRFSMWKNWLSNTEEVLNRMRKEKTDVSNNQRLIWHIELSESGRPLMVFPEFNVEVDISIKFIKPKNGISNYEWNWKIVDESVIPAELLEEVRNLTIFAVNFQQRNIAATTITLWQDATLDSFAKELYYFQFPNDETQNEYESLLFKQSQ